MIVGSMIGKDESAEFCKGDVEYRKNPYGKDHDLFSYPIFIPPDCCTFECLPPS